MAFYQDSWLILLSPLFSFVVIVFGTRMWDLAARHRMAASVAEASRRRPPSHADAHDAHGASDAGHAEGEDDDEDPKVPRLTMGARVSGYVGILIVALACLYSWLLLLDSAGVHQYFRVTLPASGVTGTQL